MLVLDKVQFKYGKKKILHDVSFSLKKGEIGSLIGASGSGKTTLFKLLTGLLKPNSGNLTIGEELLSSGPQQIACMCQDDMLLPWRNIIRNLTLLAEFGKNPISRPDLIIKAKSLLTEMNLSDCAEMYPHELSGGMKQRVSLARALLQERPILLLDEPFGSLDICTREHMYALLREIKKKQNSTMLMVTHDFRDALILSDHIFFLKDGTIQKKWEVTDCIRSSPAALGLLQEEMRKAVMSL